MFTLASLLVYHGGYGWAQKADEGRETEEIGAESASQYSVSSLYTGFLRKEEGTLDTYIWIIVYKSMLNKR